MREAFVTESDDRVAGALFSARADAVAEAFTRAFSSLARRFEVTVVGGLVVLPSPEVRGGQVVAGRGVLQAVSAVFSPHGRALAPLSRKLFPAPDERSFLLGADLSTVSPVETPALRYGRSAWKARRKFPPSALRMRSSLHPRFSIPSTRRGSAMPSRRSLGGTMAPS